MDKPNAPLIVGIGASAGGLDAFKSFFANTPVDTGLAFVLVQHLSPDHKSLLAELVGRTTPMSVIEAIDGMEVEANGVIVIPPDATMTIKAGRLEVLRPAPPRDRRRPIDTFLQSLADDQGENAVGVILSGTGSDGALGLAAIKEKGGLTLAQAEFDHHALPGMPQSATSTGQVDDVLAVEAMPARIVAHRHHLSGVAGKKDGEGTRTDAASALAVIMGALRSRSGHDFSEYKQKTLVRRLQRRMQVLQLDSPAAYVARLREQPEELDLLFRELLIGVTQFFRDPAAWDALASSVIREMVAGKGADDEIRVWVPACATGQEAFTLAILIREAMDARRARPKVQIFGTDIDERAITVARAGRYRAPAAGLSAERARRWFSEDGDGCCVVPEIREMCVFSTHSVIKHPPFSKLDLISCRNLLIYLDPDMQDRVMRTFHYALKAGGRLFLGSSESVTRATGLFAAQEKKHRIFERRDIDGPSLPDLSGGGRRLEVSPAPAARGSSDDRIDKTARRIMEKYYPPHVVIDGRDQIVSFSGAEMGRYLEPSPGAPSFALFDILRKSLRPAVRAAVKEARAAKGAIRRENIPARIDGGSRLVTLIAEPMADRGVEAGVMVLAFQDAGPGPTGGARGRADKASSEALASLEQELRTTRAQLQSTIDELEVTNEEMKSSNEEYQSVNEELQSSNEELETAKEEMQSVNEEIQTVNAEMVSKNERLTLLNSDQKNLFESTEIATLFLDEHLKVRIFTAGVTDIFHLRETDIGRPITEIAGRLDYDELQRDVKTVLRKLAVVERQVALKDAGITFILRMRPYRTIDNVIDGVVLTFIDITERQAAQEAILASEARFRMLFDFIDEGFCLLEKLDTRPGQPSDFRYLVANPGFEKQSGLRDVVGKTIREVVPGEPEEWFDIYDAVMATGKPIRFERDLVTQGRTLELFAFRFEEGVPRLAVIFIDVSQRKRHEEQQDLLLREMDHRIKNLFAIVGGVVSLSARAAATPSEMAATIQGRLGALASAHVLIRPRWPGSNSPQRQTTLGELIAAVLSPYDEPGKQKRFVVEGPATAISGDAITSLALVAHELATNAVKYGALSTPAGRVHLSWAVRKGRLALTWEERGGPVVEKAPEREGFGSLLARRSVQGQLDGKLAFDWTAKGLIVRLSAPMERLTA